jgi:hypothetical protein
MTRAATSGRRGRLHFDEVAQADDGWLDHVGG